MPKMGPEISPPEVRHMLTLSLFGQACHAGLGISNKVILNDKMLASRWLLR